MSRVVIRIVISVVIAIVMMPKLSWAETMENLSHLGIPALALETTESGGQQYTLTLEILAVMTLFTFLPAMILMMTCFTRVVIVFSILRQAIGLQQTPSNQVILGLAMFLSLFIMSPILERAYNTAVKPYMNKSISAELALERVQAPFRVFMLSQTREPDLQLFLTIQRTQAFAQVLDQSEGKPDAGTSTADRAPYGDAQRTDAVSEASEAAFDPKTVSMTTLIPAFVISELKTAFQIGFMLFIPFLIIDLVVASILMAMGMMMLSPLIVSLPFKIMLFVFLDGWAMIVSTLTASFGM
ncbi:MAG: flagellar type III secretion system pore protein FliP [Gammaproteobacteria bacterium]